MIERIDIQLKVFLRGVVRVIAQQDLCGTCGIIHYRYVAWG